MCGGEDYADMHEFAIERAEALKDFTQFEDGVPLVDTFERVLGPIEANSLNACLMFYAQDIIEDLQDKHIAINGKAIRGSKKHKGSRHILSAWVSEHGLSLPQVAVEEYRTDELDHGVPRHVYTLPCQPRMHSWTRVQNGQIYKA
ncbi:MAG: ISAs1 family transposase [Porphyromonas sp.]|nr:ISAs1 family transposase [Porphyromonas sp.]